MDKFWFLYMGTIVRYCLNMFKPLTPRPLKPETLHSKPINPKHHTPKPLNPHPYPRTLNLKPGPTP